VPIRFQRAAAAAALVFLLAGCSKRSPSDATVKSDKDRKPAPAFSLTDARGTPVTLAEYRGKVVLLNFWATWCGPCEVEIPWFIEFEQKYKDRDFAVLGVSFDDDGWKSVRPYIAAHKINYRIMIGTEKMSQLYGGVDSLPTTFIVDRQGRIAAQHVGLVDKSDYQNEILKLLDDQTRAARDSAPGSLARLLRPDQRP
jgi:peroxiredoxin